MAGLDLGSLQQQAGLLREQATQADRDLAAVGALLATAQAEADRLRRLGADPAAADARVTALAADQRAAAERRTAAWRQVHDHIAGGLLGPSDGPPPDPGGPLRELDPTVPIALLPVRVEIHYPPETPDELLVRIFPDDLHKDAHEPELTPDERARGRRFAADTTAAGGDVDKQRDAWTELARRVGPERAAWVAAVAEGTVPDPGDRGATWTRAAHARLLPDRWAALLYGGGILNGILWAAQPVPDQVPLSPDPLVPADQVTADDEHPPLDPGLRWLSDFTAAEQIGLGIRIRLAAPVDGEGQPHPVDPLPFDRLVVVGVRTSLDPTSGAAALENLLAAHHHTSGLAIAKQNTPTNNTPTDRADWTAHPSPHDTFAWERQQPPTPVPGSNADRIAETLGVAGVALARTAGATGTEQPDAAAMATALWAATWGHYMRQLMHPLLTNGQVAEVRRFALDHVRGRGTVPSLRVGPQPYGMLPITSLPDWQPYDETPVETAIAHLLMAMRPFWQDGISAVPVVRPDTPDLDGQFVRALARTAVSDRYQVRTMSPAPGLIEELNPVALGQAPGALTALNRLLWLTLGLGGTPFVFSLYAADNAARLLLPTVDNDTPTQLTVLHDASPETLAGQARTAASPRTLLHVLARHSLLLEYAAASWWLVSQPPNVPVQFAAVDPVPGLAAMLRLRPDDLERLDSGDPAVAATAAFANAVPPAEPGFVDLLPVADPATGAVSVPASTTNLRLLGNSVAGVTGDLPAGEFIHQQLNGGVVAPYSADLRACRDALTHLSTLPSDQLDLLLRETLDTATHRFDAWVTALADRRLAALRRQHPQETYVGGYGVVDDPRRRARRPVDHAVAGETDPGQPRLYVDLAGGGFVHAPSIPQATSAAVLRAGALAHAASDGEVLQLDLSSARVRTARRLLEGVRSGQPLGALLGYELERALQDDHPGENLVRCVAPLRRIAPLVAGHMPAALGGDGTAHEQIAAANVVDGLALHALGVEEVLRRLTADPDLTPPVDTAAVRAELRRLEDHLDAVADLLLAEAVHQLVLGSTSRTAAVMSVIGDGLVPPQDIEVARTPRAGTAITARVLILLDDSPAADRWATGTPRSAAEPHLDGWLADLLPDPAQVRIRYRLTTTTPAAGASVREVRLAEVSGWRTAGTGVSAVDAVLGSNAAPGATPLERRLVLALADDDTVTVALEPSPGSADAADVVELEALLETCRTLRSVITGARPLGLDDLTVAPVGPVDPTGVTHPPPDSVQGGEELLMRAQAAAGQLRAVDAALAAALAAPPTAPASAAALRQALAAATAVGLPIAASVAPLDVASLAAEARSAQTTCQRRIAEIAAVEASPPATTLLHATALMTAALGPELPVLPLIQPPNAAALAATFASSTRLQDGDPSTARAWLDRMATVRDRVAQLAAALLYADALGTGGGRRLVVGQQSLATSPPDRWVALRLAGQAPPNGPTTSFVAHAPAKVDFTRPLAGLVIDDWIEVIPSPMATTAIALQADTPVARAPQAVLLAVSPNPNAAWDVGALGRIVSEAVDLAALRLVDLGDLAWAGRLLPAIYLPDNPAGDTVGVPLKELLHMSPEQLAALIAKGVR
jgi:hypothetical protein